MQVYRRLRPIGYRVDDTGHFQINEERAEVVRWIFSGKIPRLRQLIELYVERVEILPDSVSVTLKIRKNFRIF